MFLYYHSFQLQLIVYFYSERILISDSGCKFSKRFKWCVKIIKKLFNRTADILQEIFHSSNANFLDYQKKHIDTICKLKECMLPTCAHLVH